jgi:SAM-dependent methyltransferase
MSDWQAFFDGYAPVYMTESFTRHTEAEVDFLVEQFGLRPGCAILDLGCGTGRHTVALAGRGFLMTGVDLSKGMLAQARAAAEKSGVTVQFIQADATRFSTPAKFDYAICLCEGSFGLVNEGESGDEHDLAILRNVHASLAAGGGFLLTALNGFRAIRQFTQADVLSGRFDPLTLVERSEMSWETPSGRHSVVVAEKKRLPQDLARLCQQAGFVVDHIWGGTAGNWARRPVDLDEMEVMLVVHKPAGTVLS